MRLFQVLCLCGSLQAAACGEATAPMSDADSQLESGAGGGVQEAGTTVHDAGWDAGWDAVREGGLLAAVDAPNEADATVPPSQIVQTCRASSYVDRTQEAAGRILAWGHGFGDEERCLIVRVGQTVRWLGSLSTHPLDAEGGDSPNPIVSHNDGVVTFGRPGTFGYVCGAAHAGMYGAIYVVP